MYVLKPLERRRSSAPVYSLLSPSQRRSADERPPATPPSGDGGDPTARLMLLCAFLIGLGVVIVVRLWYLQILDESGFETKATTNTVRTIRTEAPRGRVLAADGTVLVGNRMSLSLGVDLGAVKKSQLRELSMRLGELLHIEPSEIRRRIDKPKRSSLIVPVADDVPQAVLVHVREFQEQFPGVVPISRAVRTYPTVSACATATCPPLAPHVVGYVGETNADDLTKDPALQSGDSIGRGGVEASLETDLRGVAGERRLKMSSTGRTLEVLSEVPAVGGDDVVLTLDPKAQLALEAGLQQGIEAARSRIDPNTQTPFVANAASGVVLDPSNGAVLALASLPAYDPSQFTSGIPAETWTQLNDPANGYPLTDRAVSGLYAPGSTFKVVTAAAGLAKGLIGPDDTIDAGPSFDVGGRKFRDWKPGGHGTTDLAKSLVESVDVYYYRLGYAMWQHRNEGDWLQDVARAHGLAAPTGIDLPGEKAGRVPDAAWKSAVHAKNPQAFPDGAWQPGDMVNLSIGQGDLVTTPLQMAAVYAAFANGGVRVRPHVFAESRDAQSGAVMRRAEAPSPGRLPIDPELVGLIDAALGGVVADGTAKGAFGGFPLDRVPVAGKTGTAQVAGKQDTSWFVSFAPANAPKYVIAVAVEQAGHGGETAAPISRYVYERLFGIPTTGIKGGVVSD